VSQDVSSRSPQVDVVEPGVMSTDPMEVTIALEARYAVAPDGSVWSQAGMARGFWERYLEIFDTVRIVARGTPVERVPENWLAVNGKNILFHRVPDFHGPWQCLKRYPSIRAAIRAATPAHGAVILRVGSQVANFLEPLLHTRNYPYALEVIGDPYDVFAPGVVDHPLRPFFRWHFSRHLRRQCLRATGVAYVTKRTLQERYPAQFVSMSISDVDLPEEAVLGRGFSTHYSSIELGSAHIAECIHKPKQGGPYQLVTVGSLAQRYKGTDVLIEAVARCVRVGLDLTVVIVGDGKYRPDLTAQSEHLGMASRIQFTGQVKAGEQIRHILDTADLFVLPSRTEGLPRALIEAMARGIPCIGSAVGGIPELLDASELVPAGDPAALAAKIQEVLKDPSRMETMSHRNLSAAMEFSESVLAERRRRFYRHVRDSTQNWEAWQNT
jgi:glycosyltransferase involved in cell wall biosynthesis